MVPVHLLLCPRHSACSLHSRECQLRRPYTVTTKTAALRSRISVQQLQHWSAYSRLCQPCSLLHLQLQHWHLQAPICM
eukprot:1401151-Rhodomonas_salina.1